VWGGSAEYHDNEPAEIADAIERAVGRLAEPASGNPADRFAWDRVAPLFDDTIERVASGGE